MDIAASTTVPHSARFRHVVFKSSLRRRMVNMAPAATVAAAASDAARPPIRPLAGLPSRDALFLRWLFEAAGLDVSAYRVETLRRRLPAALRHLRAATPDEARQRLTADPSLIPAALNALVIGVTSLFRDLEVFDELAAGVLPTLRRRVPEPRIWCAGCSSGEEVYSIAVLLAEAEMLDRTTLLGTDCRPPAIRQARDARYDARVLRDLPEAWRRHFVPEQHAARVCPALRAAPRWRVGDLTRAAEPGAWDLILCRNVVMYFTPQVAARVWQDLESALRPGGFLVLGKAERPLAAARLGTVAPCIYRRDRM